MNFIYWVALNKEEKEFVRRGGGITKSFEYAELWYSLDGVKSYLNGNIYDGFQPAEVSVVIE